MGWTRVVNRATEVLLIGLMAAIVVLVFSQVVLRYGLRNAPPWTEEMARWLFTWVIFIGTPVAYKRKAHIVIDILIVRISERPRRVVEAAVLALGAAFLAVVVVEGIRTMQIAAGSVSSVMEISLAYVFLPIPLGAAITLLHVLDDLWTVVRWRRG